MKFGLDDKIIDEIQKVFQDNWKIDSVVIFGSRAKGNYREGSDIDLAVKGRDVSFHEILSLISKLDDIHLPYEIDLINYSAIQDENVIEHVDRVGIVFYERWKRYKWGDIATLEYGKGLNNYGHTKGKFPVYGTNGKIGTTDKFLCSIPGIIIGRKGAYRGVQYSSTPFYVIDTAFFLKPKIKEIDIKFAYYQLLTKDINNMDSGSAIPSTSREDFYALEINLPPYQEQISIAELLTVLDDKVDLLQRQNKTLEQLAETLFRQWFVEEASEDWEVKSLIEVADYLNGLALQKYSSNGIDFLPVIKIRELKEGISENTDKCSKSIPSQYVIHEGDVLFSWSGSLEVEIWHDGQGALNQYLFKVSSEKYPRWFYYLATKIHLPTFKQIAESKTTTMGHIQREHLKQAIIAIPGKELFKQYDQTIAPLIEKKINNNKQIRTLIQLRDTLLPKLITGEVRTQLS